jgi:hypothetical protein
MRAGHEHGLLKLASLSVDFASCSAVLHINRNVGIIHNPTSATDER